MSDGMWLAVRDAFAIGSNDSQRRGPRNDRSCFNEAFYQKTVTVRPDFVPHTRKHYDGNDSTGMKLGVLFCQPSLQLNRAVSGAIWQRRDWQMVW